MDGLDGIPLFRCGMQFGPVTNSSDFVLSQLHRSSYDLAGRSFPWYILESNIWIMSFILLVWYVGMIVLTYRLPLNTSLLEGDAKRLMTTSNGRIEITLGSSTIRVPNFSRYITKMWFLLVVLISSYEVSLAGELHAKFSMTASDGGRSSYESVGHSSPWYVLDMDKPLWIMSFLVFVWTAGLLVLLDRLASLDAITAKETIEIPKTSSARTSVQVVCFSQYLCGLAYPYPYVMVPKYNLQLRRSSSRHSCEASLNSARHKSESCNAATSEAVPVESSGRIKPEHRSVPTDSCDTAEQHCCTVKVEAMVAASSLVVSAAPNSATWNSATWSHLLHSLLSGFTPQYGMKIIASMIIKMYVASMKIKMLDVENKYLSQTSTSSEHKDEHLGATRALSELQTEEENTLVVMKAIPHTKPEHPSDLDTISAEDCKATAIWLIATATPQHATGDRSLLSGFTPGDGHFVEAGDGSPMKVLGRGSVVSDTVILPDVWFVPGLTANLVSVSKLVELDYSVGFARTACYIRGANDAVIGKAHAGEDGMFELDFLRVPTVF